MAQAAAGRDHLVDGAAASSQFACDSPSAHEVDSPAVAATEAVGVSVTAPQAAAAEAALVGDCSGKWIQGYVASSMQLNLPATAAGATGHACETAQTLFAASDLGCCAAAAEGISIPATQEETLLDDMSLAVMGSGTDLDSSDGEEGRQLQHRGSQIAADEAPQQPLLSVMQGHENIEGHGAGRTAACGGTDSAHQHENLVQVPIHLADLAVLRSARSARSTGDARRAGSEAWALLVQFNCAAPVQAIGSDWNPAGMDG